jgi:hypothetical protein
MRHKQRKIGRNRATTKGTLLMTPIVYFVPVLPRIAAGLLERDTSYSLTTLHKQCKIGRNRAVKKGTLLLKPKQFVPISPPIAAG